MARTSKTSNLYNPLAPVSAVGFQQLPALNPSVIDTMPDVRGSLRTLEMGHLRQATLLAEQMLGDDRISAVMRTRIGSLMAANVNVEASSDAPAAEDAATEVRGYQLDDDQEMVGLWPEMYAPEEVWQLLWYGLMTGIGVGQQVWKTDESGQQVPHLRVWSSQFVRWDWAERCYKLLTANAGEISLPRLDDDEASDGEWILYTPFGYYRGWLWSYVRWLADKYIMRQWDYRDWARFCEVHGQPKLVAYVPQSAKEDQKDAFEEELAAADGEMVIRVPVGDGGRQAGWGVEMIEAKSRTGNTFESFLRALNTCVDIGVLGQNLTTEAGTSGTGGSRAMGQVHAQVKIQYARDDARIADCLRRQGLVHWARLNHGDPALAPVVTYDVDPPENELEEAQTIQALGAGMTQLVAVSPRLDVDSVLENFGLPLLSDEEFAARQSTAADLTLNATAQGQIVTVNEARSSLGLGPWPGADGDLPVSEFLDKYAPKVAAQLEGGQKGAAEAQDGLPSPGDEPPAAAGAQGLSGQVVKRYVFQGLPISVENAAGTTRRWIDADGKETGSTHMLHDYGFIEGVMGSDGEEVDCYVGPDQGAKNAYVVHQLRAPDFKVRDEDKTMLGFSTPDEAQRAYLAHRNDGDRAFGGMSTIPIDRFKEKLVRRRGTGPIRASAPVADVRQTMRMLEAMLQRGRTQALAGRRRGGKAGARARLYGDLVADRAVRRAAALMAPRLAEVKDAIRAAGSLDRVKGELLRRYKQMDPAKLAGLVRDARLMARLGGRASARKQTR